MIRRIKQDEMDRLVELCALHAAYEQSDFDPEGKAESLRAAIFGHPPAVHCLVVEVEGKIEGFATFMEQYSTWDAEKYMYLDCLFLTEGCRGRGLGKDLMDGARKAALLMGCTTMQWQTPDFNASAIRFYRRLGAFSKEKERFFWALDA